MTFEVVKTMKEGLLIGELSRRVNLPTQTIRYYERMGILAPPKRTASHYRVYSEVEEERLAIIQKAKRFSSHWTQHILFQCIMYLICADFNPIGKIQE